jgi:hypothetical protein
MRQAIAKSIMLLGGPIVTAAVAISLVEGGDVPTGPASQQIAPGPLKLHPANSRYFTDGSGRAIYLTGSHNDPNLLDIGTADPPPKFDFDAYLSWLESYNHNFIRLWRWTEATKFKFYADGEYQYVDPHPWKRTGPGTAGDGKPKFDLHQFNDGYFDRIRYRAQEAARRGIYVSIMLFEGGAGLYAFDYWEYHPFHGANNINNIDVDANRDGKGLEYYTLMNPTVTTLQAAYVRKVVDTVNDLNNVLYEISNETHESSTAWQYFLIRYIKHYESDLPKQHPVGMTTQHGESLLDNSNLFDSPADWISLGSTEHEDFASDPPMARADKVSILDSDHITPGGSYVDVGWVWKSFTRGHNPILLDLIDRSHPRPCCEGHPCIECVRANMGYALNYAKRMNLAAMIPDNELCSSRYCLANPGSEYLVYVPSLGAQGESTKRRLNTAAQVAVDLTPVFGPVAVEWMSTTSGDIITGHSVQGGAVRRFVSPFMSDSVLYLQANR